MKLTRSHERLVAGVCAGIAEHFGWSRGALRATWVFLSVLTGGIPGIVAYTVLAVLMPGPTPRFDLEQYRAD